MARASIQERGVVVEPCPLLHALPLSIFLFVARKFRAESNRTDAVETTGTRGQLDAVIWIYKREAAARLLSTRDINEWFVLDSKGWALRNYNYIAYSISYE